MYSDRNFRVNRALLNAQLRLRKHRNKEDKELEKAASTRGRDEFPERGA